MTRNTVNFLLDLTAAAVVLGLIATGLLMRFVLPPGSGGLALWGLGRHDWGDVHFWLGRRRGRGGRDASGAALAVGVRHDSALGRPVPAG